MPRLAILAVSLLLASACLAGGEDRSLGGQMSTPTAGPHGPSVVFDPLALPVPEVPFPSDLLLTPSRSTASGAAWNISTGAPTRFERELRERLGTLDGFGPFAPIMVSFDGPIDLATVTEETVLVVNIEPDHPREGAVARLDLGHGNFPLAMNKPGSFWPHDVLAHLPDLLLGEDNDADGDGDGVAERVGHYEVATNTLLIRPVVPLDEGAQHAVLITTGVSGPARGQPGGALAPIRSPFPYKAHAAQVPHVARAVELAGLDPADLAFGWTFTTARMADLLVGIRAGLHGEGKLARLAEDFPPVISEVRDTGVLHDADPDYYPDDLDPRDTRYILQPELLNGILELVSAVTTELSAHLRYVDYLVFGSFPSPDIRTGSRRTVGVDPVSGRGDVGVEQIPFIIGIPKATDRHQPPFPVVLYFHGSNSSRLEMLALLDALARQGIAGVAFDQVGHGPIIPDLAQLLEDYGMGQELIGLIAPVIVDIIAPDRAEEFKGLEPQEMLDKLSEIGFFAEFTVHGRCHDEDGDGRLTNGEGFFFADPFRMCASFHQDVVDFMQLVRVVRAFEPDAVPPAVPDPANASYEELWPSFQAGDFNADGVLDLGGPDVRVGVAGTSLGAFHAIMAGAVEPEVSVVTPIAVGGGFMDVMLRTQLKDVTERVFLELFGPVIVGCPDGDGGVWLSWNNDSKRCKGKELPVASFAHVGGVSPGDTITVRNDVSGEQNETTVNEKGGFSLPIAADRWDRVSVLVGELAIPVQTPYEGLGFQRNSPELRRFLGIGGHVLDRCDPVNYARHLFLEPLPGHQPVNILIDVALGDWTVPISGAIAVANAAGLLGEPEQAAQTIDTLIARGVVVGAKDFDIDDLLGDNPPEAPAIGPLPPVPSGTGYSAIRFADVAGDHEWIAAVDQAAPLDHATLSQNRIALYHLSGGRVVVDDQCIAHLECEILDDPIAVLERAP